MCLLAGCSTAVNGNGDAGGSDATDVVTDQFSGDVVINTCGPGMCRLDPSGPCGVPGGPLGSGDAGELSGCCGCGADGLCNARCACASPETPIGTPGGDRPIASLAVGDLVYSVHHGRVVAVPLLRVQRIPVTRHRVVRVTLANGDTLEITAAHPTADGRTFGALHSDDWLGGQAVRAVETVPYAHEATYDILPDSDTGTYFAAGALIGSTLAPSIIARDATQELDHCEPPHATLQPRAESSLLLSR